MMRRQATAAPLGEQSGGALTVTQINNRARQLLESTFPAVAIVGEISAPRCINGHYYFELKDRNSVLRAVLFRGNARRQSAQPEDGAEVVVQGTLTVYAARGTYQVVVESLRLCGAGALRAQYERLKSRLQAEGLFAPERKRRLPLVPGKVGVVTSSAGAVIRDIINVAQRRFTGSQIVLFPAPVQGPQSGEGLAAAIESASNKSSDLGLSVLIVARGGGSWEDLYGFNNERVCRAISRSKIPVVSAVGHETDYTLADFVADHRAPTPSAAAELVFPETATLRRALATPAHRLTAAFRGRLDRDRTRLSQRRALLGDGKKTLLPRQQRLDWATRTLHERSSATLSKARLRLGHSEKRLAGSHPSTLLANLRGPMQANRRRLALIGAEMLPNRQRLANDAKIRVFRAFKLQISNKRTRLAALARQLDALSPLRVLKRGYAIAHNDCGAVVTDASAVCPGDALEIRLHRGVIKAEVTEIVSDAKK